MANSPKAGDTLGLYGGFQMEASDVRFEVVSPTGQMYRYGMAETRRVIDDDKIKYMLSFTPKQAGKWSYTAFGTVNDSVREAHGEFLVEQTPGLDRQSTIETSVSLISETVKPAENDADDLHEAQYDASVGNENFAYAPAGEPPSARKFKIGDAEHVKLAVPAFVNWSFRGNTPDIPTSAKAGMKRKIAAAIHKHLSGDEAAYYEKYLSTGKQPDKGVHEMIAFNLPPFRFGDEVRFPEVPTDPSVNLNEMIDGNPKPMFITRPLAIAGNTSDNGIVYDDHLLEMISSQVISKVARQGHIPEDERAWSFPDDAAVWVGKLRDGDTLYGKAYVHPNTHFAQMVQVRKAAGSTLSTSIWGNAAMMDNGDGTRSIVELELESVDFVPAERASLEALGGQFELTSEMGKDNDMADRGLAELMKQPPEAIHEALHEAGHAHKVAELHMKSGKCAECAGAAVREMLSEAQRRGVTEARMKEMDGNEIYSNLTEAQRKGVAEAHCAEAKMKMVPASEDVSSGVAEMKTMRSNIAEMQSTIARYEREDFDRSLIAAIDRRLDWKINTEDGQRKIAALKANLRVQVVAEMAGSTKKEEIEAAANRAWETFKPLAEMTRTALAGPSAVIGNGASSPADNIIDPVTGLYSREFVDQATRKFNYRRPL